MNAKRINFGWEEHGLYEGFAVVVSENEVPHGKGKVEYYEDMPYEDYTLVSYSGEWNLGVWNGFGKLKLKKTFVEDEEEITEYYKFRGIFKNGKKNGIFEEIYQPEGVNFQLITKGRYVYSEKDNVEKRHGFFRDFKKMKDEPLELKKVQLFWDNRKFPETLIPSYLTVKKKKSGDEKYGYLAKIYEDVHDLEEGNEGETMVSAPDKNGIVWYLSVSKSLKSRILKEKQICMDLLEVNGMDFEFIDHQLQNDLECMIKACEQNGDALQLVEEDFRSNDEIVLAAVTPNKIVKESRNIELLKRDAHALVYAASKYHEYDKNDKNSIRLLKSLLERNGFCLKYMNRKCQKNSFIFRDAIKNDVRVFRYVSVEKRGDEQTMDLVLEKGGLDVFLMRRKKNVEEIEGEDEDEDEDEEDRKKEVVDIAFNELILKHKSILLKAIKLGYKFWIFNKYASDEIKNDKDYYIAFLNHQEFSLLNDFSVSNLKEESVRDIFLDICDIIKSTFPDNITENECFKEDICLFFRKMLNVYVNKFKWFDENDLDLKKKFFCEDKPSRKYKESQFRSWREKFWKRMLKNHCEVDSVFRNLQNLYKKSKVIKTCFDEVCEMFFGFRIEKQSLLFGFFDYDSLKNKKNVLIGDGMKWKVKSNYICREYVGGWIKGSSGDGKYHGLGSTYDNKNRISYHGFFDNGKKEGSGQEFMVSKYSRVVLCYDGEFKNDQRHGKGEVYVTESDSFKIANFVNGKIDESGIVKEYICPRVNYEEIRGFLKNAKPLEGGFAHVYKVKASKLINKGLLGKNNPRLKGFKKDDKFAIKIFKSELLLSHSDQVRFSRRIRKVVEIATNMKKENNRMIEIFGLVSGGDKIGYIMECGEYDLDIYVTGKEKLDIKEKIVLLQDTAKCISGLHEEGIMHRDLKWGNVLRMKNESVKLMDIDSLKDTEAYKTNIPAHSTKNVGTVGFLAPEVFLGSGDTTEYDTAIDVYSFGVMMYSLLFEVPRPELSFGACPKCHHEINQSTHETAIMRHIAECGLRPRIDPKIEKEITKDHPYLLDIMKRMWDANPERRPTMKDVCKMFDSMENVVKINVKVRDTFSTESGISEERKSFIEKKLPLPFRILLFDFEPSYEKLLEDFQNRFPTCKITKIFWRENIIDNDETLKDYLKNRKEENEDDDVSIELDNLPLSEEQRKMVEKDKLINQLQNEVKGLKEDKEWLRKKCKELEEKLDKADSKSKNLKQLLSNKKLKPKRKPTNRPPSVPKKPKPSHKPPASPEVIDSEVLEIMKKRRKLCRLAFKGKAFEFIDQVKYLGKFLGAEAMKKFKWHVIYEGSEEGFDAKVFHEKFSTYFFETNEEEELSYETLVVVRTSDDIVFGGYINGEWKKQPLEEGGIEGKKGSFIFGMKKIKSAHENGRELEIECLKIDYINGKKNAFVVDHKYGPVFGGGDGCIRIADHCDKNMFSETTLNLSSDEWGYFFEEGGIGPHEFNCGKKNFKVKELTVFRKRKED